MHQLSPPISFYRDSKHFKTIFALNIYYIFKLQLVDLFTWMLNFIYKHLKNKQRRQIIVNFQTENLPEIV